MAQAGLRTLGFIGYGRVGEATANIFAETHDILWYDKYREGSLPLENVVARSEVVFVGLPTPAEFDGLCIDLEIMDENIQAISEAAKESGNDGLGVVIKSTVVPGTTKGYQDRFPNLKFAMSPEFLTDINYIDDALNPDRVVFGSDHADLLIKLMYLYRNRFPEVPLFRMNPTEAEFVKYAANIGLTMNVTLGNMFYDVAETLTNSVQKVDWNDVVMPAVIADDRVGKHMKVSEDRGFGGKCFPKDLLAFIGLIRRYESRTQNPDREFTVGDIGDFLESIWKYNLAVRRVHDWEDIPGAVAGKAHELYSGKKS